MKYVIAPVVLIVVFIGIHFFHYLPWGKAEFIRGRETCKADTKIEYVKGEPVIEYRDSLIYVNKSVPVIKSGKAITSQIDSTFISGKDTIQVSAAVTVLNDIAHWVLKINHKDAHTFQMDTIKVYYPNYITETVEENNWLYNYISFIAGIVVTILGVVLL